MTEILNQLSNYVNNLDWAFIFTFILISYGFNSEAVKSVFYKLFRVRIATRYRVLIIGVVYGTSLYFLRGYTPKMIETLVQSFVFSLVFHQLIIHKVVRYFFQIKDIPKDEIPKINP